jgi:hypothetical protein
MIWVLHRIMLGRANQYRWYGRREWVIQRKRKTLNSLLGKREENISLWEPRYRLKDSTVLHLFLKEMMWESVDWVNLAQDMIKWRAVVNTVMNLLIEVYVPVRCYVASLVNRFSTLRNSVASHRQGSNRPKFPPLKMRPVRFLESIIHWHTVLFEKK